MNHVRAMSRRNGASRVIIILQLSCFGLDSLETANYLVLVFAHATRPFLCEEVKGNVQSRENREWERRVGERSRRSI